MFKTWTLNEVMGLTTEKLIKESKLTKKFQDHLGITRYLPCAMYHIHVHKISIQLC